MEKSKNYSETGNKGCNEFWYALIDACFMQAFFFLLDQPVLLPELGRVETADSPNCA